MANWGIKVSVPGSGITSTNKQDYVFHSGHGSIKIFMEGGSTVTVSGSSTATVTIDHDLNFVPMVMLFTEPTPGSGQWRFGCPFYDGDETSVDANSANTYVNRTDFVFTVTNNTASQKVVKYYYYIFGELVE